MFPWLPGNISEEEAGVVRTDRKKSSNSNLCFEVTKFIQEQKDRNKY